MKNKKPYVTDEYYHVFNKNLDSLKVFLEPLDRERFINLIYYYQFRNTPCAFSQALQSMTKLGLTLKEFTEGLNKNGCRLVEINAYCVMPNHFHLILHQVAENGIPVFLNNTLNSFARYYNLKNDRKGPLWISPTQNVYITSDEHLWEESRYVHNNPVKARLTKKPADWPHSSYRDYLGLIPADDSICEKSIILDSIQTDYQDFVENNRPG